MTSVVRSTTIVLFAAIAAACSNGSSTAPGDGTLAKIDGRATGPSGLEQRVTTRVDAAPPGSPYTAMLTATSTLVNTGSVSAHLTARVCLFLESDVEATAKLDRFEPLISCAAVSAEGDLAPGASTTLDVQFGVRSGPGTYTLKLRHALAPDFRAETTFRIP